MRIKKTSQYIEGGAGLPSYFTTETDTGMKWIDGKTIYQRVFTGTTPSNQNFTTLLDGVDYFQIVNATFDTLGYRPYTYYIDTTNGRTQLDIAKTSSTLLQYRVLSSTLQGVTYTFVIQYTKN